MKDDVNDEVPNGTPNILIPSNGVLNWDGVLKSSDKPKRNHTTHFKSWIKNLPHKVWSKSVHIEMI
jgi:hypothetical protein